MTDQPDHHIPWGMPGPTDPVERARATGYQYDRDHNQYRQVKPVEWSQEGLPDLEHAEPHSRLRQAWGL